MSTVLKTVLFGIAAVLLILGLAVSLQYRSDRPQSEKTEQTFRDLPLERSDGKLWSPQSEALIDAFPSSKGDLEALLKKMGEMQAFFVSLFGDELRISTKDGSDFRNEDVPDRGQWSELLERARVNTVFQDERLGVTVFFPWPPRTTPDRNETINYYLDHPYPAKQCSDQFRDIPCGVCDVMMGDDWSIRFSWSSGEFESEYSENLMRVYQDDNFVLTKDEIEEKRDIARDECKRHGLEEMGYEDPGLY